jgi:CubicO group peptidase (beta-lactamase class C family)
MQSGLDCDDWITSSPGNEARMYRTRDWVSFVLDLPMLAEPGEQSHYCTGGVILLGHVVSLSSGMDLDDFADQWLFGPLEIRQATWWRSPDGAATGGGGLRLRPRDAAKLGALYAAEGLWNGRRVVPEDWVLRSRQRMSALGGDGYGYLWWKRTFRRGATPEECFFASGNGGNYVFVFPTLELVIAFTGSNYDSPGSDYPFRFVEPLLGAIR